MLSMESINQLHVLSSRDKHNVSKIGLAHAKPVVAGIQHRMRSLIVGVICLLVGAWSSIALGQEPDTVRLGHIVLRQPSQLRLRPDAGAAIVRPLESGTRLYWVEGERKNGFLRVMVRRGPIGWIPDTAAQLVQPPPPPGVATTEAAKPPCRPSLDKCPPQGCAIENSPQSNAQGLINRTKRRAPIGPQGTTLIFADLQLLQEQATRRVGQGTALSKQERDRLVNLTVSQGTVREGSLARISGFIAQGLDPHVSGGESVNCKLPGTDNNDFHISVAERPDQTEFQGIVVEMIPQDRSPQWTIQKLLVTKKAGRRVRVVGALFYDNLHVVNADPQNPIAGQPARFSLWELHPIVEFSVCVKADNACDVTVDEGWQPLSNFSPSE
jgi:hypothetical protein